MGKVYFPRFVMPISSIFSNAISLVIQAAMFTAIYIYFVLTGAGIALNITGLLIPLYLLHLAVLGTGVGAILSALTTKYRDTGFLISYGVTFWMYLSPIVYDINIVPEKYMGLYMLNPVTPVLAHLRYALFEYGSTCWNYYGISLLVTLVLLIVGYRIFNRVQRTFLDTI